MTYEEALNTKQNWTPIQARNDLERYLLRGELPAAKAFALGMQALEKQIPTKPKIKKFVKTNGFELRCPNDDCGAVLQSDSPCCKYCGQALDWSDTE